MKANSLPDLDRPVGVPAVYADHARLMFDLQVLALQGDVTRVITFQLARETSNRTYPEIGVPDPPLPFPQDASTFIARLVFAKDLIKEREGIPVLQGFVVLTHDAEHGLSVRATDGKLVFNGLAAVCPRRSEFSPRRS